MCSFVENFRVVGGESLKQRDDGVGRREKILQDWGFRAEESDMVLAEDEIEEAEVYVILIGSYK